MAWVEKQDNGKFVGRWREGATASGNPRKPRTKPYDLKRDAREDAQEQEVKARRRAAKTAGTLSARTSWGDWWEILGRTFHSDTGMVEGYILKHYLMPQWGDVALNRIEKKNVQRWVNDLTAGDVEGWKHDRLPEPSYVERIYSVFSSTVTAAVKAEVLEASPCVGIKLPKRRKKPRAYMPVEDAPKLKLRDDYRDAVDFALETGLRPSELCGLHIRWVDKRTGWLYVVDSFAERSRLIRPPKDEDARKVPLSAKALEIVERRMEGRSVTGGCGLPHADGKACDSALVFLTARGRVMRPKGLYDAMTLAAKNANLPQRGGYTLRRGWGTRISEHLSPWEIARYFGHETLEQSADYIQETSAARARMLAALGETTPLTAVTGQDGADDGADIHQETPGDTGSHGHGKAG